MVTIHAYKAITIFQRAKGLLGEKRAYPLFFDTRWGIHTFGMRFAIDVVILDREKKVVILKKNLKPYRIFMWNPVYENVLELPKGEIQKLNLKKEEKIKIEFKTEDQEA